MTTESRLSRLEGAYEQVNERLADHIERFADISRRLDRLHDEIQGVRGEMQGLREEMSANVAGVRGEVQGLREEMSANIAGVRGEVQGLREIQSVRGEIQSVPLQVQPNRRCVPPPNAGAAPGRCVAAPDGAPTPGSSRLPSWPTPPAYRRRPRRPRSTAAWGTGPTAGPAPTWRRPGLGCQRDGPPPPTAGPRCPPRCGACVLSLSCPRHSLWAPFFRGLHRLAVDDGRAGAGLTPLSLPQGGVQGAVGPLPGSIPAPGAEVMEDDAPGRQVVGQHPPRTSGAQHVADGVDDLPTGVGDRSAARFGWWQQRFEQLPFSVAEVAGISWSFHTAKATTADTGPACIPPFQLEPF